MLIPFIFNTENNFESSSPRLSRISSKNVCLFNIGWNQQYIIRISRYTYQETCYL